MMRRFLRAVIPLAALAIIAVGFATSAGAPVTDEERAEHIASQIRCPFCRGESIASATTDVARDLRIVIDEQIAAGATDAEVFRYFTDRYGESVILSPPLAGWGLLLWLLPLIGLGAGLWAIAGLRRDVGYKDGETSGVEAHDLARQSAARR